MKQIRIVMRWAGLWMEGDTFAIKIRVFLEKQDNHSINSEFEV